MPRKWQIAHWKEPTVEELDVYPRQFFKQTSTGKQRKHMTATFLKDCLIYLLKKKNNAVCFKMIIAPDANFFFNSTKTIH